MVRAQGYVDSRLTLDLAKPPGVIDVELIKIAVQVQKAPDAGTQDLVVDNGSGAKGSDSMGTKGTSSKGNGSKGSDNKGSGNKGSGNKGNKGSGDKGSGDGTGVCTCWANPRSLWQEALEKPSISHQRPAPDTNPAARSTIEL